jgi:hypothetical protein
MHVCGCLEMAVRRVGAPARVWRSAEFGTGGCERFAAEVAEAVERSRVGIGDPDVTAVAERIERRRVAVEQDADRAVQQPFAADRGQQNAIASGQVVHVN